MSKKMKFIKRINEHDIYQLTVPIGGLDGFVIVKDLVIKKSFPSIEEAEAFSHVDSPELIGAMESFLAEEELEQHPPTFWQKIWLAFKGLKG